MNEFLQMIEDTEEWILATWNSISLLLHLRTLRFWTKESKKQKEMKSQARNDQRQNAVRVFWFKSETLSTPEPVPKPNEEVRPHIWTRRAARRQRAGSMEYG
jgi:hypothetical protein